MRINVGCGPHRAEGWVNLDLVHIPGEVEPDLVICGEPLPFSTGSVEAAYFGHVLEHIAWADLPAYLARVAEVLAPGGRIGVVGPDTFEALNRWREGREGWDRVAAILEGTGAYHAATGGWAPLRWDADRHHWNCDQDRVAQALTTCGWTVDVIPRLPDGRLDAETIRGRGWPLVDDSPCQFALEAHP